MVLGNRICVDDENGVRCEFMCCVGDEICKCSLEKFINFGNFESWVA